MAAAEELLVAMTMVMMMTVVATTTMLTMTMTILRTLHRRNYSKTIIAAATLSRQG